MKKNYVIIHCLGRSSDFYWYPWLKKQIEQRGYDCFVPDMPGTMPELKEMSYQTWANVLNQVKDRINEKTTVIGHSIGSVFLAHFLIENKIKVNKFIGVVSFNKPNTDNEHKDWDKINEGFFVNNLEDLKQYAKERICFYSPTDIYDFKILDDFANTVDAEKVIIEKAGHFTAVSGYGEKFEEILKYIE